MYFPSKEELNELFKNFEIIQFFELDEKNKKIIIQIDTIIQEYKVIIKQEKEEYDISYQGTKLKKKGKWNLIIQEVIDIFLEIREKFMEESTENIIEEFNQEDLLTKHSYETNIFYGKMTTNVIKELEQVRFQILPDLLNKNIQQKYEIDKRNSCIFGLQFGPDYIDDNKIPNILFKKESIEYNTGFSEHIINLSRKFIQERWKQIKEGNKKCKIDVNYSLNIDKNEKIKKIKKCIEFKEYLLSSALSLYYSNFNRQDAISLLIECDIIFEDIPIFDDEVNILIELITFLYLKMNYLTESCLICDEKIKIQKIESPTICTNFKCQFEYIEMRVCTSIHITICPSSIYKDLLENEQVVDLLICMCYSAASSNRRKLIFNPFPPQFIDSKNQNNYEGVIQVLDQLPSVKEMLKKSKNEQELYQLLGKDCYILLSWILTEKRVALLKMPEKKRIQEMKTEYQYLMLCDDPDKSSKFLQLRQKYGSYFAFHGSGPENWHSILRRGLFNCSGTELMTTGQAYGSGVYMAEDSATSFSYSKFGSGWKKSSFGDSQNIQCIAICEVIKAPNIPIIPNPYYVVDQPLCITTRFFLFYPKGSLNLNIKAKSLYNQLSKLI